MSTRPRYSQERFDREREPDEDFDGDAGQLDDGRAFILERWTRDGEPLLSLFFNTRELEQASTDTLLELVQPILEKERVPRAQQHLDRADCVVLRDEQDEPFYALTFVLD